MENGLSTCTHLYSSSTFSFNSIRLSSRSQFDFAPIIERSSCHIQKWKPKGIIYQDGTSRKMLSSRELLETLKKSNEFSTKCIWMIMQSSIRFDVKYFLMDSNYSVKCLWADYASTNWHVLMGKNVTNRYPYCLAEELHRLETKKSP